MRHLPKITAALFLLLGDPAGCAPAVEVHTSASPQANFERYHSVAIEVSSEPPSDYSSTPESVWARRYAQERAARTFLEHGYVVSDKQTADLIVRIETGRRVTGVANTQLGLPPEVPYNVPNYDESVAPTYHGYLDQEPQELVRGALVIDAFDAHTHERIWHGIARAPVDQGKVDYAKLQRAVDSMLASFPSTSRSGK